MSFVHDPLAEESGPRALKKMRMLDSSASTSFVLSDQASSDTATECKHKARRPTVRPVIDTQHVQVLFDWQYRVTFPNSNAPAPTPTRLRLYCAAQHGGVYHGTGTFSILAGTADFYMDPACNVPFTRFVGPDATVTNAELTGAGLILYVLGRAEGALDLSLTLQAQDDALPGAARRNLIVVRLSLEARSFEPRDLLLTPRRRIVNGTCVGIPVNANRTVRKSVMVRSTVPDGYGSRLLELSAPGAALYQDEAPLDLAQPLANGDAQLWLQGTGAPQELWLSVGLRLADNTVLHNGDLLKVRAVDQPALSVGFEWENNNLMVERRHDGNVLRPEADWEGLSSKAKVVIRLNGRFRLDTEVSSTGETYGEFVIGPAYDHAELQTQLAEVRTLMTTISSAPGRTHTVLCPANIMNTNPNMQHLVWMPANHPVVLSHRLGWGGTAQASFAAPLWLLPTFLAEQDNGGGRAAKLHAESFADADAGVDDNVLGLIAACQYYIECLRPRAVLTDDDGPKTALPVMFRTHFSAMYALLAAPSQQQAFIRWKNNHAHRGQLLCQGYNTGGGHRQAGPTIGAWLDSIVAPPANRAGRDLMSPPPGFAIHDGTQIIPYAMGLLGLDPNNNANVIAECRDYMGNINGVNAFILSAFRFSHLFMLSGQRTWQRQDGGGWG